MDLADRPRFFVRTVMGLNISRAVGLAIGRAILTGIDITIGFFGLSLW